MADLILKECIFYDSYCYDYGINNKTIYYKGGHSSKSQMEPIGVLVHSTGCNQTKLARFVQPSKTDPNYDAIIADIGKNKNNNHWNKPTASKCVHAMIGKNLAGTVEVYQTLPYNYCCWGCGAGSKGSYNYNPTPFLQYECLEDDLTNEDYFNEVFGQAIAYTAYLCQKYGWDSSKVTSHYEANLAGYASDHKDPSHWLARFGKDMNWFRSEVQKILDASKPVDPYYEVGDIVLYNGIYHYTNATAGTQKSCIGGKAYVKQVAKGKKHPYNIKHTEDNPLGTVDGWVDAEFVAPYSELPENKYEIGEEVEVTADKYYSYFDNTATPAPNVKGKGTIISRVPMNYPHPYQVEIKYSDKIILANWFDEKDLQPVAPPDWEALYKETEAKLIETEKQLGETQADLKKEADRAMALQNANVLLQKQMMLVQSQLDAANAKVKELDEKNQNLEDNIGVLKEALDKALAKTDEAKAATQTALAKIDEARAIMQGAVGK